MKVQLIIVLLLVGIINTQGQSPPLRLTSADENLNILALPVIKVMLQSSNVQHNMEES